MATDSGVVETAAAPPGLLDVLHVVSAHFPVEGNLTIGICQEAWRDERIWMAIIDMMHRCSIMTFFFRSFIEAPRLVIASEKGRLDVVTRLLDLGANIDTKTSYGDTALISACRRQHEHVASFLLDRHLNIDMLNEDNRSALYYACYWANVETVRALLERGANVDLGEPPILAACEDVDLFDREDTDMSTLWVRRWQVVRLLVDHNANLNVVGENGATILMHAVRFNQVAIIELLLDRHVDIDVLNDDDESALYIACSSVCVDTVRALLERGANVDLGDPPILAVFSPRYLDRNELEEGDILRSRRSQVIRLLADYNANLNVVDLNGWTVLMIASQNNQADIIELLLDRHVDIDSLNNNNETALYQACYFTNVELTRLLLARGANVDLGDPPILAVFVSHNMNRNEDEEGNMLVWARRLQMVRLLTEHSANLNVVDGDGETALFFAAKFNQADIMELLLDRHVDVDALNNDNMSPLGLACLLANVEAVRVLLMRGANVDLGEPILYACQDMDEGNQALVDMTTLWARRLQVVRMLADHNANLNIVDEDGETALILASRCNQADIMELLLDRHVDIDALNKNNFSALGLTCHRANVEAVRVLLTRGANVDLGEPPILYACQVVDEDDQEEVDMSTLWARRLQVVRMLADHNANLNIVDEDGWTAIMWASQNNQADIMELLLDRHVDIDALNNDNMSALGLACYYGRVEAVRLLLTRGANVDLGEPPILYACQDMDEDDQEEVDMSTLWARRYEIVVDLVRHNALLTVVNAIGEGPLDLANANEQRDIAALLADPKAEGGEGAGGGVRRRSTRKKSSVSRL